MTIAGAVLRLIYISQPMRYDESYTWLRYASRSVFVPLVSYTVPNNHIFHSVLVAISGALFGNHPWAIRLPAFIAGTALTPLSFAAARRFYSDEVALLTAAFVASSSPLIEFSTNARGYALVACAFLILLLLAPSMVTSADKRTWVLFTVVAALGFLTIPTMLFPFGSVVAWIAIRIWLSKGPSRRKQLVRLSAMVLATGALTALFYLPAVIGSGVHAVVANRFVVPLPWHSFTHQIGSSLSATWNDWNRDISIVGAVTFAAFFLLGAARARADLPFVVAVWCGVLVIEQRWVPFPRIWTFAIPVYWMSVSAGVDAVIRNKRWIQAIALTVCISIGVATLVSGSVLTSRDTGYFPDAERVALALRDLRASDRVLAYLEGDAPLEYYAGLHEEKLPIGAIRPTDSRLFIVVDRAAGQTLASVAAHFRSRFANVASLEHAAPWKHFARADIYVYERA